MKRLLKHINAFNSKGKYYESSTVYMLYSFHAVQLYVEELKGMYRCSSVKKLRKLFDEWVEEEGKDSLLVREQVRRDRVFIAINKFFQKNKGWFYDDSFGDYIDLEK